MDEELGKQVLEDIWQEAKNRQGVSIDKKSFIQKHVDQIRRINKGYWVEPTAKQYIGDLERSLPTI